MATQAELMHRAGHKSSVAAQRYEHATEDRDRALAHVLANLAPAASNGGRPTRWTRNGRQLGAIEKRVLRKKAQVTCGVGGGVWIQDISDTPGQGCVKT